MNLSPATKAAPAAKEPVPMESVRALLNRILDYAGLFPPAKLDMAATVANYAAYMKSDHAWVIGRLIIPVARLEEFEQHAAAFLKSGDEAGAEPWQISAIVSPASSSDLAMDISRIESFNINHEDEHAALIDVIELKAEAACEIDNAMDVIPEDLFPFFEISVDQDPRGLIAALAESDAGAKVRTGGITADAYPSPESLARFIAACAAANVPFKATAGLHHPLRHLSEAAKTKEFGFLNVFLAGCLAQTHELAEPDLVRLLAEESAAAIRFTDDSIEWNGHRIDAANVEDVRECFAASFGSCSFDEPVEDLKKLKLL